MGFLYHSLSDELFSFQFHSSQTNPPVLNGESLVYSDGLTNFYKLQQYYDADLQTIV